MRRLKWLLIATHVPEHGGGGGVVRYSVEITRGLEAHDDIELHVLAQPASWEFFKTLLGDPKRVHVTPGVPTAPRSLLERAGAFIPALTEQFDIVHGTKHLLPRRCPGVRVLTVHDMLLLDRPHDYPIGKRRLLRRPFLESLREAHVLVCVSSATRERLCAYLPSVQPRTAVVPLATSYALRHAQPEPIPELAGRTFALVVGDPSPRKNIPLVVNCWQDVVARVPGAILVLVGPPSWGVALRGSAFGQLADSGLVAALGHVSDGKLRWCYENARVVLCPSLLEGFGFPVVEALTFGAPVITSDDPALCEVSGDNARHLSSRNAAAWGGAIADALTRRGRQHIRNYGRTWADVAEETVRAVRRGA